VVDTDGARFLPDDQLSGVVDQILTAREGNPGGAR
jgi:hypothetical protein